jgi:hypothetical protein
MKKLSGEPNYRGALGNPVLLVWRYGTGKYRHGVCIVIFIGRRFRNFDYDGVVLVPLFTERRVFLNRKFPIEFANNLSVVLINKNEVSTKLLRVRLVVDILGRGNWGIQFDYALKIRILSKDAFKNLDILQETGVWVTRQGDG